MADFVEAQPTRFTLGVAARGAERGEIVVAVGLDRGLEIRGPGGIGGADQRVQRKRRRPVAARELIDERANARWVNRSGHGEVGGRLVEAGVATGGVPGLGVAGLFCGGVLGGGVVRAPGAGGAGCAAFARRFVLSARGSMSTPVTESTVVTMATLFETLFESKSIVMMRAVT